MAVTCTRCPGQLTDHCPSPTCYWLVCRNKQCAAYVFDVRTGRLRLTTGAVIVWDQA